MSKKVVLYTTSTCPYCIRALRKLDEKGVKYENINVRENPEQFDAIMAKTGWDTVPQIFVEDQFIGGCDDLHALDRKGELDAILGL
jgi:glutaredoxin 3